MFWPDQKYKAYLEGDIYAPYDCGQLTAQAVLATAVMSNNNVHQWRVVRGIGIDVGVPKR